MAVKHAAPARPIHEVARFVDHVLHRADSILDTAADSICRNVLGTMPKPKPPTFATRTAPEDRLDMNVQRAYRHDAVWAIPGMWWEMALGAVGAGTFLGGTVTGNLPAMAFGWVTATCGKGALLFLDLGRPERVHRVFVKPGTSWIARGSWAFATFALAGGGTVALQAVGATALSVLPGIAALAASGVLMTYDGYFLKDSAAVSGWQTNALPWLFAANALVAGGCVTAALSSGKSPLLAGFTLLAAGASGLLGWSHLSSLETSDTAAVMTRDELTTGIQQPNFLVGGGILGTAVPAALGLAAAATGKRWVWSAAAALSATGVLLSRKAVLQSGIHAPVI